MLRRCNNSLLFSSKRVVLPDELIKEVLSFLPVKSLLQLRCVCKSWKILISDPIFVKLHLKRSARNPHITLVFSDDSRIFPYPVHRILDTISISISIPHAESDYPNYQLQAMDYDNGFIWFVGSYNGLLCFVHGNRTGETLFYLWNPATKTLSNDNSSFAFGWTFNSPWKFAFGYDNSTHTYKIVAFHRDINKVKVFNFGNNVCRSIESFPVVPFHNFSLAYTHHQGINDGVYVSNAINWLAIRNERPFVTIDQFVIISLDLSTETYRHLSPPPGFAKVTSIKPTLAMLMDSLCFSHDFSGTHFVIWRMKEFGIQDSWTQFFKISYQILPFTEYGILDFSNIAFFPLWLSRNGDTLILTWDFDAILYNLRDNRALKIRMPDDYIEWFLAKDYVESLVSTC